MQKQTYKSKRQKSDNTKTSELIIFLKCMAVYILVFVISSVASLLFDIDNHTYTVVSVCSFSVSSFLAGFVVGRTKRKNGLVNGVVYSLPATVIFTIVSVAVNGFKVDYILPVSVLCMLLFAAAGGVISVNIKKKAKVR